MHKLLRTFHLLGLGGGFGALLATLAGGTAASAAAPLVIGGLSLAGLSGVAMMVRSKLSPFRLRWLPLHIIIAGLGAGAAIVATTPAGAGATTSLAIIGALLLTGAIAVGVFKPRLKP